MLLEAVEHELFVTWTLVFHVKKVQLITGARSGFQKWVVWLVPWCSVLGRLMSQPLLAEDPASLQEEQLQLCLVNVHVGVQLVPGLFGGLNLFG